MAHREFVGWQVYFARMAQREQLAELASKAGRRG
jgi:hypothetical protein